VHVLVFSSVLFV